MTKEAHRWGEMDRDEKKIHGWGKRHRDDKKETCVGKDAQGRGKIARHGLGKRDKCGKRLHPKRKEQNRTPRNIRGELGTKGTGGKRDNENTNKNLLCEDSALVSKVIILGVEQEMDTFTR